MVILAAVVHDENCCCFCFCSSCIDGSGDKIGCSCCCSCPIAEILDKSILIFVLIYDIRTTDNINKENLYGKRLCSLKGF